MTPFPELQQVLTDESRRTETPMAVSLPAPKLNNHRVAWHLLCKWGSSSSSSKKPTFPSPILLLKSWLTLFPKRKGNEELPTHSNRVIWRATVLWTRKGRPEPLPDVHEWSSNSCNGKQGEKEITELQSLLWSSRTHTTITNMVSSNSGHVTRYTASKISPEKTGCVPQEN